MEQSKISQLIASFQAGNEEAFSDLYMLSYPEALKFAMSRGQGKEDAEEIVNDAFLKVYVALTNQNAEDALQNPDNFKPWLFTIVRHCIADVVKKQQAMKRSSLKDGTAVTVGSFTAYDESGEEFDLLEQISDGDPTVHVPTPEEIYQQNEAAAMIRDILEELPEGQRAVLELYYRDEMKIREIAAELHMNENTVKSNLRYGKKAVEKKVNELEKRGVKLHSFGGVGFLTFLYAILKGTGSAGAASAAAGATVATGAAAVTAAGVTTATAASAAAGSAATAGFLGTLAGKLVIGATALTLIGGGTVAGVAISEAVRQETVQESAIESAVESAESPDDNGSYESREYSSDASDESDPEAEKTESESESDETGSSESESESNETTKEHQVVKVDLSKRTPLSPGSTKVETSDGKIALYMPDRLLNYSVNTGLYTSYPGYYNGETLRTHVGLNPSTEASCSSIIYIGIPAGINPSTDGTWLWIGLDGDGKINSDVPSYTIQLVDGRFLYISYSLASSGPCSGFDSYYSEREYYRAHQPEYDNGTLLPVYKVTLHSLPAEIINAESYLFTGNEFHMDSFDDYLDTLAGIAKTETRQRTDGSTYTHFSFEGTGLGTWEEFINELLTCIWVDGKPVLEQLMPETTAPEMTTPETNAPETNTPEMTTPETNTPEPETDPEVTTNVTIFAKTQKGNESIGDAGGWEFIALGDLYCEASDIILLGVTIDGSAFTEYHTDVSSPEFIILDGFLGVGTHTASFTFSAAGNPCTLSTTITCTE